jgi:hypothetical protein
VSREDLIGKGAGALKGSGFRVGSGKRLQIANLNPEP